LGSVPSTQPPSSEKLAVKNDTEVIAAEGYVVCKQLVEGSKSPIAVLDKTDGKRRRLVASSWSGYLVRADDDVSLLFDASGEWVELAV
jgi:hypothetical protein